jgi:hypothetical protein
MNHLEIQQIYDDLDQFVSQKKWPINAVLIGKLQEIHNGLRRALNLPYQSPPKRASQFGRAATGSASKATEERASKDDDKFTLQVETPERRPEQDSDDEVPDLEQFLYEAEPSRSTAKMAAIIAPKSNQVPHSSPPKIRTTATMTSPTRPVNQSPAQQQPKRASDEPRQSQPTNRQCLILSDSSFRIVSGFLSAVIDKKANAKWTFTCHSIGGATISSMYQAAHEGMPVAVADEVILHVGINDVGVRHDRPAPATLKREYTRLIRKVREKYPAAKITLSHIFPIKTGDVDARRAVQIGNTAMEAALAELRDNNTRIVNFGEGLLNGSLLRSNLYDNARHLNAKGGRFVSFNVRNNFGLIRKEKEPTTARKPPPQQHQAQERRNPWTNNKIFNYAPPKHNTNQSSHHNNTRYTANHYDYAARSDSPAPQRPNSKVDLLEKTLSDFSRRLIELFL